MSTVLRRQEAPSANGTTVRSRAEAVSALRPPAQPTRRRWGRLGAGLGAAILGAWLFAALYLSAGDRTEVLVLTTNVDRFDVIERSDLRTVRISSDNGAATVPAGQLDSIVGRVAATDLVSGAVLSPAQLLPSGDQLLTPDEAVVGILLGAGDSQMSIRRGSPVALVVRPPSSDTSQPIEVTGWVFDTSGEALNSRERPISVAVPRAQAAMVSAAAADKRVTILVLPE